MVGGWGRISPTHYHLRENDQCWQGTRNIWLRFEPRWYNRSGTGIPCNVARGELSRYQQIRGRIRLTVTLTMLDDDWYVILVTVRLPNPAYERLRWFEWESTEPSHLEEQTLIPTDSLDDARRQYRHCVKLVRFMGHTVPEFEPVAKENEDVPKATRTKKLRWDQ